MSIINRRIQLVFYLCFLIIPGLSLLNQGKALGEVPENLPGPGDVIPAFSVPVPKNPDYRSYLKLDGEKTFVPGEIKAKLILIEVFNVYCASCNIMAPYMDKLYAKVEKDPELKDTVKMIGIGAGNDVYDIANYEDTYRFPIIPDDDYAFHNLVGQPATPFLMFTKPYGQGRLFVVDSHLGRIEDSDILFSLVRKAFDADIEKIKADTKKDGFIGKEPELVIPVSDKELMEKVRQSLSVQEGEELKDLVRIPLANLGTVYAGTIGKSDKHVFARVVSRKIPCGDCHDVFYVYSFDDQGKFLQFVPLSISKLGNEQWDKEDIAKIQNHFSGKSLLKEIPFNPEVDAVSSATISSRLIYDSLDQTAQVYYRLMELGYIPKKD